jgi:hypothetical protein
MTEPQRIERLVEAVRQQPNCEVLGAAGLPTLGEGHVLPDDLRRFFEICGGLTLYRDADYAARIVGAIGLRPANPLIVGRQVEDDISASWYVIADDLQGEYLTIDLSPARLGRCYDSFSDRHALRGSCPVIALSFSELLERLIKNDGQHWYWLRAGFESLGDAYD